MDDPSQSAAGAAARQDRALQEKYREKLQEGALTGLEERNSKWDVEYEGKDAVGTLVRPFEPGFGDARRLPEKMLGESNIMAVMRSMGRGMPHSGAGDGTQQFKTEDDPERMRKMIKEEAEKDGVGRHFSANQPKSPAQKRAAAHLARMNKEFPGSPVMKGERPSSWLPRRLLEAHAY